MTTIAQLEQQQRELQSQIDRRSNFIRDVNGDAITQEHWVKLEKAQRIDKKSLAAVIELLRYKRSDMRDVLRLWLG